MQCELSSITTLQVQQYGTAVQQNSSMTNTTHPDIRQWSTRERANQQRYHYDYQLPHIVSWHTYLNLCHPHSNIHRKAWHRREASSSPSPCLHR